MSNPQDARQAALQILLQHGRQATRPTPTVNKDGWEALTCRRPEPGASVPMRKRLGPRNWAYADVWPGDSRYPWPDNFAPRKP